MIQGSWEVGYWVTQRSAVLPREVAALITIFHCVLYIDRTLSSAADSILYSSAATRSELLTRITTSAGPLIFSNINQVLETTFLQCLL